MIEGDSVSWTTLHISLRCWALVGTLDCGTFPAQVVIPRATIGLTDSATPTTTVSGGELAGDGPVRGVASLAFHASDAGGGVYRSIVSVDGDEVARRVVDGNGGRCADVELGNADDYEFATPQPCPLDVSGEVALDTSALHDGSHAIRVSVEDAAGNVDVVRDAVLTTHNAPVSTALPTLSGAAHVGSRVTAGNGLWDGAPTGFGYRWLRCGADGGSCAGIPGADGPTYVLTAADAYHRVLAEVTAANGSGAATASSGASAPIADAAGHVTPPPEAEAPHTPATPPQAGGGIQGLSNPLAAVAGHVSNGASSGGPARLAISFRLTGGRTARHIRSARSRGWTIVGRLLDGTGHGIAGARLGPAWRVAGGAWVAHGGIRTGSDGRFAYALPPGPSRTVKLTYFAFSDSRAFVASNVVQEDVLAAMTIRADRRRVTGARVVRLGGRVGGAAIPAGGVLVTLEGYQRGWGWRTFRTVRTTRTGVWGTRYRFRLAHGRFGFRAVVPHQSGFPFITTRSKAIFVLVA
jgi:hypothetical protein